MLHGAFWRPIELWYLRMSKKYKQKTIEYWYRDVNRRIPDDAIIQTFQPTRIWSTVCILNKDSVICVMNLRDRRRQNKHGLKFCLWSFGQIVKSTNDATEWYGVHCTPTLDIGLIVIFGCIWEGNKSRQPETMFRCGDERDEQTPTRPELAGSSCTFQLSSTFVSSVTPWTSLASYHHSHWFQTCVYYV